MSDDGLDIRRGGVVAVDTASLRHAASELGAIASRFDEASAHVRAAAWLLADLDTSVLGGVSSQSARLAEAAGGSGDASRELGRRLARTAAAYEYAELAARRAMLTDETARAACDARMAELRGEFPEIESDAGELALAHDLELPWSVIGQAAALGTLLLPGGGLFFGGFAWVLAAGIGRAGFGTVARDARLGGTPPAAFVVAQSRTQGTAVTGLAQAARRIPTSDGFRVEKYAMPDGSRQFVLYVAGTGASPVLDGSGNLTAYGGGASAGYEAARAALREAGAAPGDRVHAIGHSQGGMIVDRLALEGEYDVETVVTFGSPVQADVPESVLSVDVRHDDDPVAALDGRGFAAGVGSPDSIVVSRTADPVTSPLDLQLPAHHLTAYAETAAMLDASSDPRMHAVRAVFAELDGATSVETTVFSADRPEAAPQPAPRISPASSAVAG